MPRHPVSINVTDARLIAHIRASLIPKLRQAVEHIESVDGMNHNPALQACRSALIELIQGLDLAPARRTTVFWQRVLKDDEHMIWTGAGQGTPDGTPICDWDGRRTTAAKVAWLLITGYPVPEGQRLRRICKRKRCVAPGCHTLASPTTPGRVTNVRYNDLGQPVCKRGHTLKRIPRPRETVYCSQCYRTDKVAVRGWEDIGMNQPQPDAPQPAGSFRRAYDSTRPDDTSHYLISRASVEAEERAQRVERGLPVDPPPTPTFDQARLDAELAALFNHPAPAWQPAKPPASEIPDDDDDTPRLPD